MKIRSVTYFCHPRFPLDDVILRRAGEFLRVAQAAFEASGYEVQTTRIATTPFPRLLGAKHLDELAPYARELDLMATQVEAGYVSLGPALPNAPRSYELIPEAIAATKNVFLGGLMTGVRRQVDLAAVRACADIIVRCAPIEANGFANLRFAALANVPAGAPFFPAAYHAGQQPAFAIATEAADLAVEAFAHAGSLQEGRKALVASIEKHGKALAKTARALAGRRKRSGGPRKSEAPEFLGIDFSLAPFPEETRSVGAALELIGAPRLGLSGSLAAAAILTEAIDRARFPRTGFSGLFLPVQEDAVLARRAAEDTLTLKDLLMFSAVCGTGLDTVPLPGDSTAEQLIPVLLDLSTLALRLDKPLTARLMPIPNKKAGEATDFNFEYFANSRVMKLESSGLAHIPRNEAQFTLQGRSIRVKR